MRVGIVGAGQLARMLALAGAPLGLDICCVGRKGDPASAVCRVVELSDHQPDRWKSWAEGLDALTFEHENVQWALLAALEDVVPLRPPLTALQVSSDRLAEKRFFAQLGLAHAPYRRVDTLDDLLLAMEECGLPGFLKVRRFGFDGRGQHLLTDRGQAQDCWPVWSQQPGGLVYEKKLAFRRELSQLTTVAASGEQVFYPLAENEHRQGILWQSRCLAEGDPLAAQAQHVAQLISRQLGYVGTLAVELFDVEGVLYVNEIAPRVHNSGHWSIEASCCSQFENHLRAVCQLPLGSCDSRPAVMLNCLGQLPRRQAALAIAGLHYHDYQKQPRPQRKVGHVTVLLDHPSAQQSLCQARALLAGG